MSEKDTTSMAAPSSIGNGNGKGIGNENGNGNGNENGSPTGTVAPVQSIEDASPAGSTPSVTGSTPNANTTGKAKGKKAKAAAAAASTAAGGAEAGTGTGAGTESDMPMSKVSGFLSHFQTHLTRRTDTSLAVENQTTVSHLLEHVKYKEHSDSDEPNISLRWKNESTSSKPRILNSECCFLCPKQIGIESDQVPQAGARVY